MLYEPEPAASALLLQALLSEAGVSQCQPTRPQTCILPGGNTV